MFVKLVSTVIIFLEVAFFGYLPYIWSNFGQNKKIMSRVGCFASGLFLALALLHILPESNQQLQRVFAMKFSSRGSRDKGAISPSKFQWGSLITVLTFVGVLAIESSVHKYLDQRDAKKKKDESTATPLRQKNSKATNTTSVLLTQLALSLHGFIECLALGSQTTSKATLTLLIGIGCHKWAEGLTLGFQYKRAKFSSSTALKFCMFHAFLNGGAILLGWWLSSASQMLSGILGAISAGTFLYVSTVQKVSDEFSVTQRIGQKILCMLVGIGFVCLII